MDTVEELKGTYYFNGLNNLSAYELLFWVMVDETEKQLGVKDIIGVASITLGDNSIEVPGKPNTATKGTSHASFFSQNILAINSRNGSSHTAQKNRFHSEG